MIIKFDGDLTLFSVDVIEEVNAVLDDAVADIAVVAEMGETQVKQSALMQERLSALLIKIIKQLLKYC